MDYTLESKRGNLLVSALDKNKRPFGFKDRSYYWATKDLQVLSWASEDTWSWAREEWGQTPGMTGVARVSYPNYFFVGSKRNAYNRRGWHKEERERARVSEAREISTYYNGVAIAGFRDVLTWDGRTDSLKSIRGSRKREVYPQKGGKLPDHCVACRDENSREIRSRELRRKDNSFLFRMRLIWGPGSWTAEPYSMVFEDRLVDPLFGSPFLKKREGKIRAYFGHGYDNVIWEGYKDELVSSNLFQKGNPASFQQVCKFFQFGKS